MITDASIAGALLWRELTPLAEIHGHPTSAAPWRVDVGRWTLTADTTTQSLTVDFDGHAAGTIGPGETADISGRPPEASASALRRAIHEHVYQHYRSHTG